MAVVRTRMYVARGSCVITMGTYIPRGTVQSRENSSWWVQGPLS